MVPNKCSHNRIPSNLTGNRRFFSVIALFFRDVNKEGCASAQRAAGKEKVTETIVLYYNTHNFLERIMQTNKQNLLLTQHN